ncbi:hypothetical protein N9599_02180 [Candidatus Pelagibacter sp.]|nr:hypothetical protein [Candidatus Pelagibacter sp.]
MNSIVLILSFIILYKKRKIYISKKFFLFLLLSGILITFLIAESHVYRPDAGLYHLPFISILNSEKIVLGLSNLNFRYGHASIMQYFSAISNNLLLYDFGIVFAQAIIAVAVIINFSYLLLVGIQNKKYSFHLFYIFFILTYIFYKMNRYGEYGNDAPAHFLVFFLISEIILNFNKNNNSKIIDNLILTLFIIQTKVLLIPILIFNTLDIFKIKPKKIFYEKNFYFLFLFFLIWIVNNILLTGCFLYPLKISCLTMLSWTEIESIQKLSIESEVWAKAWSNLDGDLQNTVKMTGFLKDFFWLNIWSETHLKLIIKKLAPYLFYILIVVVFLNYNSKKLNIDNDHKFTKYQKYLIFFALINILFWFMKAPIYRYGYSSIIVFIALIAAYILSKKELNIKLVTNTFIIVLILGYATIFIKNSIRIIKSNNTYINYPWPRYYSMDESNTRNKYKTNILNGVKILKPITGYCMYTKNVCSSYGLDKNLNVKKINKYTIFYFND